MEKFKKYIMGFSTFICMVILISIILVFPIKKTTEKYLKEEKIKQLINKIDFVDIFINENIDSEHFKQIKDKLTDSGIPTEIVNDFIKSEPVKEYTGDILSTSINNTLNGKEDKLVKDGEVYTFLENNISNISTELQEKNVPHSELLTKENQQVFLNRVKDKVPDIENKINELQDKINEKLKEHGYLDKVDLALRIVRIIYGTILDMVLIILFIVFVIGIIITRQSIYKSLKWIGISFIIASITLIRIPKDVTKLYKHIDKLPNTFAVYIKGALKDIANTLKNNGIAYLIIGIILIIINVIIYFILEKRKYKELKSDVEITKINKN